MKLDGLMIEIIARLLLIIALVVTVLFSLPAIYYLFFFTSW